MIDAESLRRNWPEANDGSDYWYLAKPEPMPFRWRLIDAWFVLLGRAEAVSFRVMSPPKKMKW